MKFYKSYMIIGLFALGLTACNTDDLERDLDALKDRVENFEAQVQKLNDDMNIIRVMLDGNKTISEWSYDGSKYTIKLSNGETLTLTQGVVGENYPSVTIGENGNWFIAGEDSGIKASAEKGPDAPYTPIFKIESGQWCVSHDNGTTWTNLGVSAVGSADTKPSPIKDVNTDDPNYMEFTLSNDQVYKIPVVKSLICEITEAEVESDGLMYLGYEEDKTFKLKVNLEAGDILRPVVPAEWKVEIPDYTGMIGEKTLDVKVIAPSSASKCVIAVELNRGLNTVTDEIVARTTQTSLLEDYLAGFDIEIGDMKINKKDYKTFKLISEQSEWPTSFDSETLYFLQCDLTVNSKQRVDKSIIIIGDNVDNKSKLTLTGGNGYFALNPSETTSKGLLLKNIELSESEAKNYIVCFEGTAGNRYIENVVFDDCIIKFNNAGSNRTIINVGNSFVNESILNFSIINSIIKLQPQTTDNRILYIAKDNTGFSLKGKYNFKNNLLYCSESNATSVNPASASLKLLTYADKSYNIDISNNTFVNVFPDASQAYIQSNPDENSKFIKNIIFVESSWADNCFVINPTKVSQNPDYFTDNLFYDVNSLKWKIFRNSAPSGFKNDISLLSEEPFTDKIYSIDNFTYNLKENYKEYGMNVNTK